MRASAILATYDAVRGFSSVIAADVMQSQAFK